MNLHSIVAPAIGAVNPLQTVGVRINVEESDRVGRIVEQWRGRLVRARLDQIVRITAVSYTHLTLPTICSV